MAATDFLPLDWSALAVNGAGTKDGLTSWLGWDEEPLGISGSQDDFFMNAMAGEPTIAPGWIEGFGGNLLPPPSGQFIDPTAPIGGLGTLAMLDSNVDDEWLSTRTTTTTMTTNNSGPPSLISDDTSSPPEAAPALAQQQKRQPAGKKKKEEQKKEKTEKKQMKRSRCSSLAGEPAAPQDELSSSPSSSVGVTTRSKRRRRMMAKEQQPTPPEEAATLYGEEADHEDQAAAAAAADYMQEDTVQQDEAEAEAEVKEEEEEETDLQDASHQRLSRVREKNRIAARRCRQRKRQSTRCLTERHDALKAANRALRETAAGLEDELLTLKGMLVVRGGCGCAPVRRYLGCIMDDVVRRMSDGDGDGGGESRSGSGSGSGSVSLSS